MLKWNFEVIAEIGVTAPSFAVSSANITLSAGKSIIEFVTADSGELIIDYFSKKESDTVVDQTGTIVADTQWRITKIWCDGIKLESWFLHDCVYTPEYFDGFLEIQPDAPKQISAPYQFNFPGSITWSWNTNDFWLWYFHEKNKREVINFLDKDPDRVWKFRGSTEDCNDLVSEIKKILQ